MTETEQASPLDVFAATVTFLLPVAHSAAVSSVWWSPKAAIVMVLACVGGVLLLDKPAARLRTPTMFARAFVLAAALATSVSARPALSVLGHYGWGTGLIFVVSLAGAWAVGTRLSARGKSLVAAALVSAAGVNILVAILEMTFDLSRFGYARFEERAPGLLGNPIYLGPLLAAAVALVVPHLRAPRANPVRYVSVAGFVVMAAVGMSLSGSRTALALCVIVAGWTFRQFGREAAAVVVALLLGGWVIGPALDRPPRAAVAATSGATTALQASALVTGADSDDRASGIGATLVPPGNRSLRPRLDTWWSVRKAVAERPILGAGPGQFRAASIRQRPLSVDVDSPDRYFVDAHNLAVEYAATTGLVGLALLALWLVTAGRGAGGPFLLAAGVLFISHLIQPQTVSITPMAFLLLGASRTQPCDLSRVNKAALAFAAPVGVVLAGLLLLADFDLRQAALDFRFAPAQQADSILRPLPEPAFVISRIHAFHGTFATRVAPSANASSSAVAADRRARDWLWIAAQRDPNDIKGWALLADFEYAHGHFVAARRHYLRALDLNRHSARVLGGLGNLAAAEGNDAEALRWFGEAHAIDPTTTPPRQRLQRARVGRATRSGVTESSR